MASQFANQLALLSLDNVAPAPPTAEEQTSYYWGLPGHPKLVARSNPEVLWDKKQVMYHSVPTEMATVGRHPIVTKLDSILWSKILACLKTVDWDPIDVVRIGKKDPMPTGDTAPLPVILWVGVKPDSLSPRAGLEIAMACRKVLVEAGLDDVHCEIRECSITNFSAPVLPVEACVVGGEAMTTLTSSLGQSLASEHTPHWEGCLTAFLRLVEKKGHAAKVVAMTSNHVVFKDEGDQKRGHGTSATARPSILMPGTGTLNNIIHEVDEALTHQPTDANLHDIKRHLQSLAPAPARHLGRLLFAQAVQPKYHSPTAVPWLPDYALLEVNPARLGGEFSSLSNKVFMDRPGAALRKKLCRNTSPGHRLHRHRLLDVEGPQQLRDIIPVAEIRSPHSGLCHYGAEDTLMSLRHYRFEGQEGAEGRTYYTQWSIVGIPGHREYFSQPGDSGSCIFDLGGRIGGIVDAGVSGQLPSVAITYATPMQWILDDLRKTFYEVDLM